MKILIASTVVLTLLAGALLSAEEPTLLGKLEREIQTMAERADRAVVSISVQATSWKLLQDPRKDKTARVWVDLTRRSVAARTTAAGVLVGDPPVIVTAADAVGAARTVDFRLADGRKGKATLRVRDVDLGVCVYALPAEVAEGLDGLDVAPDLDVARGRLAVAAGPGREPGARLLDLVTTRGSDAWGGWFYVDGAGRQGLGGLPLVGSDGRLLGIATSSSHLPPSTTAQSCRACHRFGPGGATFPWGQEWFFYGAANRERLYVKDLESAAWAYKTARDYNSDGDFDLFVTNDAPAFAPPPGAFLSGGVIARVLEDLEAHGRVRHSYLGVVLGQTKGKGDELGVEIQAVLPGSPAEKAGVKAGSRIRAVDGKAIHDPALLSRVLVLRRPGET
ncbi:MAG: S1 family peptidase, partial [Planctomycetota bacterium]